MNFFFTLLSILTLIFTTKVVFAKDTLVRSYFTETRDFYITAPAEGKWLNWNGLKIFLYHNVVDQNEELKNQIESQIKNFINNSNEFWKKLEYIAPGIQTYTYSRGVYISIDDFKEKRKHFQSYHLKDVPQKKQSLIVLDLEGFQNEDWIFALGHELIHAYMASLDIPIWVEEIIAQHTEFILSGKPPKENISLLIQMQSLPSPISTRRPFANHETYAMNFLFGEYLMQNFGEYNILRALNPRVRIQNCARLNSEFDLEQIACRIQNLTQNKKTDWIDADSLILNFTAALLINQKGKNSGEFYVVPHWPGFSGLKNKTQPTFERGSFSRVHYKIQPESEFQNAKKLYPNHTPYIFRVIRNSTQYKITEDLNNPIQVQQPFKDEVISLF